MKKFIKKIIGVKNVVRLKQIYGNLTGNFLTYKPLASENEYLNLHQEYIEKIKNDKFILKNFSTFDIKFVNDLALITQVVKKKSKINWMHGFILMKALRDFAYNKDIKINIFETGTSRGFSSIIMSYVLNKLDKEYCIDTLDLIPHDIKIYWNCISDVKNGKVSRRILLCKYSDYLEKINFINGISSTIIKTIEVDKIDFAFLDGSHEYEDVKLEFEFVDKRNKKGDIIVLDDYTPTKFDGIVKLVKEIKSKKNYNLHFLDNNKDRGYVILKKN